MKLNLPNEYRIESITKRSRRRIKKDRLKVKLIENLDDFAFLLEFNIGRKKYRMWAGGYFGDGRNIQFEKSKRRIDEVYGYFSDYEPKNKKAIEKDNLIDTEWCSNKELYYGKKGDIFTLTPGYSKDITGEIK
jgi:hypothetical protein